MTKKIDIIDKYFVLHCRGHYEEEVLKELTTAIVSGYAHQNGSNNVVSMGTPCITTNDFKVEEEEEDQLRREEEGGEEVALKRQVCNRVTIPWSNVRQIPPYLQTDILTQSLSKLTKLRGPLDSIVVKEENSLDLNRLSRLREFLAANNCVSFILPEKDKRTKNGVDFIKRMAQQFKFGFETWTNLPHIEHDVVSTVDKDELLSIVNFFDIKAVAPVFDTRKVDGVALSLEHCLRSSISKKKMLVATDSMFFVFTNYLENILTLDGCKITDHRSFDMASIEKLSIVLSRKAMQKASASAGGGSTKKCKTDERILTKTHSENRKEEREIDTSGWTTTYRTDSTGGSSTYRTDSTSGSSTIYT